MLFAILALITIGLAIFIGWANSDSYGHAIGHSLMTIFVCSVITWAIIIPLVLSTTQPSRYSTYDSQKVTGVTYLAIEDAYLIDVDLGDGLRETVRTTDVQIVPGEAKTLDKIKAQFDQWTVLPWSVSGFQFKEVLTVPSDMVKVVVK